VILDALPSNGVAELSPDEPVQVVTLRDIVENNGAVVLSLTDNGYNVQRIGENLGTGTLNAIANLGNWANDLLANAGINLNQLAESVNNTVNGNGSNWNLGNLFNSFSLNGLFGNNNA